MDSAEEDLMISTGRYTGKPAHHASTILDFELNCALAASYFAIGNYRKARERAEWACLMAFEDVEFAMFPADARVWFTRAMASKNLGDLEMALAEIGMAVQSQSRNDMMIAELKLLQDEVQSRTGKKIEDIMEGISELLDL